MLIPRHLRIGDFVIEPLKGRLRLGEEVRKLEPKAIDVLLCLARHSPETVTKTVLLGTVWPDAVVTEHVMTRCISQLRKALGEGGKSLIRTVHKRGYRLDAEPVWSLRPGIEGFPRPPPSDATPPAGVASELGFAEIFSASRDHVYLYDRQCCYLFANVSGAAALGLKPDDMIGRHWRELGLVPEILDPFEAHVMLAFERGQTSVNQVCYPTVYGQRCYEYVLDPVPDANGEVVAVLGIVRDITERKN